MTLPPARFIALTIAILAGATLARTVWLTADPPNESVGIVWHDEGAWVHNARNQALWGVWRTDNWNPVFVAPVFTALEYAAFEVFGVGTWQARTVPAVSGLLAILALIAGMNALAGRRAALIAGALLAANYTWVMWNRAALMESTMTAFIVVAWAAYALAQRRPAWGVIAGVATALAWFTKAAAAFFVAAMVIEALWALMVAPRIGPQTQAHFPSTRHRQAAMWTLAGLGVTAAIVGVAFVWPYWYEYSFYNWAMSVERKPSYDIRSLVDRASWLPIVHDFFTRMWLELALAAAALLAAVARWRRVEPANRLLVLWVLVGFAELIVHDSGNERRYVMFIPALVALASLQLTAPAGWLGSAPSMDWKGRIAAVPLMLLVGYVLAGSALAPLLVGDRAADNPYELAVRVSTAVAVLAAAAVISRWTRVLSWLSSRTIPATLATVLVATSLVWNAWQFAAWATRRSALNYTASVELGRLLPPGTPVHGKLANGMALENEIRPIFVGNGFGNFEDRFERDDARYLLTYRLPLEGYESQRGLIASILARYPNHRVVTAFPVDETPGPDEAVLIDKFPEGRPPGPGR